MGHENFPLKPYDYNGWRISFTDGTWQCVNSKGHVGARNVEESVVKQYATKHSPES
jgi:hypothetical protein